MCASGSLNLDDLTVTKLAGGGGKTVAVPSDNADPKNRALQSLCLLVLNLNEVIYFD